MSIGSDVVGKIRKAMPTKTTVAIKTPWPLPFIQLTMEWEKKERRKPSEEELNQLWQQYIIQKRLKARNRKKQPKQKSPCKPHI